MKQSRHAVSTVATRRAGSWSADQAPKISVTYGKRGNNRAYSREKNKVPRLFVGLIVRLLVSAQVMISVS